jgi:ABC-2 type transport system permease protein
VNAPGRSEPGGALSAAIHAEWTKLRTTGGPVALLFGLVVLTVGLGTLAAATLTCHDGPCVVDPARTSLIGVQLGQVVVAVLAVSTVGGEYGTGMIHVSLTAVPRRPVLLAAKAAVLVASVLGAAAVAVVVSLLTGRHYLPGLALDDGAVVRAGAGAVLYLTLIALLSLGVAAAVRNAAGATGIVLALCYAYPLIVAAVPDRDWQRHLHQAGPTTAGLAVLATRGLTDLPIGPWHGLAVLAAWTAAALLAGLLVLRFRDA